MEKRNHILGSHLTDGKNSQVGGYLKVAEKSTAAGMRSAKQSESCTDHLNHWPGCHILRCSLRGWALRLRLQRSVLGRGLGLALWGQPEGLRSSTHRERRGTPWQGEPRRRSRPAGEARCHFGGGQEDEGQTATGNSLHQSVHRHLWALRGWGSSGAGYRW